MPTDAGAAADLTLRPADVEDVDVLADLYLAAREAAYPAMPRGVHPPRDVRRRFAELLGAEPAPAPAADGATWVAEDPDGTVVGYLVLAGPWLDSLYVRPGRTGEGIGSALLDLAKALRPGGFGLWVFESNVAAAAFYRRSGLVTVRRTDGRDNEEQAPDLEMAWPAEDPAEAPVSDPARAPGGHA